MFLFEQRSYYSHLSFQETKKYKKASQMFHHFDKYVSSLWKKPGKKLPVLARMFNFVSLTLGKVLKKAFIELLWSTCSMIELWIKNISLTWRFSTNYVQILYYLFCIHDKFFTVHQRNIQSMAIELLKVKQNLSNSMLCDIFQTRSLSYNLRTQIDFLRSIAPPSLVDTGRTFNVHKTSWTFSECLIYVNLRPVSTGPALAYTLWDMVSLKVKVWQLNKLLKIDVLSQVSSKKNRKLEPINCNCKLC